MRGSTIVFITNAALRTPAHTKDIIFVQGWDTWSSTFIIFVVDDIFIYFLALHISRVIPIGFRLSVIVVSLLPGSLLSFSLFERVLRSSINFLNSATLIRNTLSFVFIFSSNDEFC